jgi:SAM-dependent methyltransferase
MGAQLRGGWIMSDNDWPSVIYNNTNPYPQKFLELLSTKEGYVLDCGSGDRKLDCDNVINFDITYSKGVDAIGDGHKLPFKDNSFDFIWSCSSIEHFGGHEEAAKSIKEMERVLKHRGFLALATEFVIDQDIISGFKSEHPYFFNLEALYKYLIASHNLKLVQNINFSLSAYYIKIYIKLPEESQSPHMSMHRKPHIVLCQGNVLFTSIFLFFRKEV